MLLQCLNAHAPWEFVTSLQTTLTACDFFKLGYADNEKLFSGA